MPAGSGDTRTPIIRAIEVGEVLVPKQLFPVQGEEAVEGVPSYVIEVGMVAVVRIRLPPEHCKHHLLVDLEGSVLKRPAHEDFSATLLASCGPGEEDDAVGLERIRVEARVVEEAEQLVGVEEPDAAG